MIDAVATALRRHRFRFGAEHELQEGIAQVLSTASIAFRREVRLSDEDRIDFLCEGGVGLEVKVDGSLAALTRQLHRYAQSAEVRALVVVTSRVRLSALPREINGKAVEVVTLAGAGVC
jgi:hypothetical protein